MKTCVKCSSTNIDQGYFDGYAGNTYRSNLFSKLSSIFTHIKHTMYVCLDCGYAEMYMDTEAIKKKLKH